MKRWSYIRFEARGTNIASFRDALRKNRIPCMQQVVSGAVYHGMIHPTHRKRFSAIAAEHDITVNITEEKGWRVWLRPIRLRYGLLLGLLPVAAFFWWSNYTVRSIEIYGNERISDTHLLTIMEEIGIYRGAKYADIDFSLAEQLLRLKLSDIEWISLRHTGGRLVVTLEEETKAPPLYNDRIPTNYIATVCAQITDMKIYNGTAAVGIGDAVKEGDILISGVMEDARGITRLKHADGEIRGIYQETLTLYQPFCVETTVKGKTYTAEYLECFGKRLPLTVGFQEPHDSYIYTEEPRPFTLWKHTLPFCHIRCNYTMQETTIAVYSAEEIALLQNEEALRFEKNFHEADTILGKECIKTVDDLGISLKINYVFEGVIGKTSEIFVKMQ